MSVLDDLPECIDQSEQYNKKLEPFRISYPKKLWQETVEGCDEAQLQWKREQQYLIMIAAKNGNEQARKLIEEKTKVRKVKK